MSLITACFSRSRTKSSMTDNKPLADAAIVGGVVIPETKALMAVRSDISMVSVEYSFSHSFRTRMTLYIPS